MNLDSRIELVEASFEHIQKHKDDFAAEFYAGLFNMHPQIQPLFDGVDTQKQGAKLYASLVLLVENLRHPEELQRVLRPLGKKHIGYGARPEHYLMLEEGILDTLKTFLGENWTPELNTAWTISLEQVTQIMLEGAGMALPAKTGTTRIDNSKTELVSGWLEPELMDLVEESFAKVKGDKQAFTDSFYATLFASNPQLKPLFANTNMPKQGAKLYATLVLLVENLRHPIELERVLLPLGSKHRAYGATPGNYPMVTSAILQTLEKYLGENWTPDVAAAWSITCHHVQEIMLRGAGEGQIAEAVPKQGTHHKGLTGVPHRDSKKHSNRLKTKKELQRGKNLAKRFADWFYSTSLSTIIAVWALIGITLISLSFAFPAIRGIVVFANPLSLLLALFLFIRETPERKKQFHYHAWSIIDNAAHVKTSNARFLALQDLCADGVPLKGLPLDSADLAGINLQHANLSSATMSECILADAVLDGADLNDVNLEKANLSGATFRGANLGFAKFCNANCSSTDMSNANLMFADLSNANLSGANLQGAKISGTNFTGSYLGGANLHGTDVRREELEGAFLLGATLPDGTVAS